VVVIPKPRKTDYLAPKAYRPISLLKCTRKVLEKVVATCLGSDVDHHHLIPSSQFGSRHYHSTTDTATMLRYKAEATIKAGRVGAVLLMDISCFFDSLRPSLMSHILCHLSVDKPTIGWIHSLMADCTIQIQVKDFSSEGFQPGNSTPQGSPASPILSALFTTPLL
jgi:Reverse transcriptase (RNA-dependent DNA polymerase)